MMEPPHNDSDLASQQAAVTRFFKGSKALYQAFHHASMGEFPHDILAIETALNARDAAALRRHAQLEKCAGYAGL